MSDGQQKTLFPETVKDKTWEDTTLVKRYYLNFPFYPFRTLCPRDISLLSSGAKSTLFDFDPTSPLFPANTQLNIVFTKRDVPNFLAYMLPYQLDPAFGTKKNTLTEAERTAALTYTVETPGAGAGAAAVRTRYVIDSVQIQIKDLYLQVHFIRRCRRCRCR